jgi:predicted metal-dependent hydrolase
MDVATQLGAAAVTIGVMDRAFVGEAARQVVLSGGPIDYVLRRSPRARRLRVTIDPGKGVVVTVPPATRRGWARPERWVEPFLREREGWLRRHLADRDRKRAEMAARGGIRDGATVRFRGELHRLQVVEEGTAGKSTSGAARRSTIERIGDAGGDSLVMRLARRDRRDIEVILEDWYRQRADEAIGRAIEQHAAALGVRPAAVSLRDPKTRWGSASREGRLSFSWRLVLAPPEALETVVIHELAHLRVFGHGPRFWAVVASRRPDHAIWRRWLREHSHELHAALGEGA